jgi:membrane protein YqaA with SNARE-associated domain
MYEGVGVTRSKTEKEQAAGKKKTWRSRAIPVASLVLVIAVMIVLYLKRDSVAALGNWGYLGAFLIGFIGNATVILPMPGLLLLFALGVTFNPVLVGVVGAAGGTLGEMTGYAIGLSGHYMTGNNRWLRLARVWMQRWGSLALFLFALVPILPMDIAGIAAGIVRFKIWKFLVAVMIGKTILYVGATLAAVAGWTFLSHWFG